MKSLNRTLSLVLVLAMIFGLMGVASAASFTDNATIQYKEAVDVMTGIGAINGMGDGTFAPKGSLTRAQAAKLVTYAVLGKTIASQLSVSASSFTDVDTTAYSWAVPSIEYLVSKGIINGMGDGTFDPEGNVTGYQLAKMLLCAAGYGKQGEFTGSSWQLNVAITANKVGIFTDSNATSFATAATREEAALYCFNGIYKVEQVVWNKTTEVYVPADGTTTLNADGTTDNTISDVVYTKLSVNKTTTDTFGRSAKVWYYGAAQTSTYAIGTYATTADYSIVVSNPAKTASAAADLLYWLATANTNLTVDTTGSATSATTVDYTTIYLNGDSTTTVGASPYAVTTTYAPKVGDVIEVFVNDVNPYLIDNIVVTRYALAKLSVATASSGTKDSNGNAVSYLLTGTGTAGTLFSSVYNTVFPGYSASTYVKDAYVAVACNAAKTVLASYVPTLKTGAVSAMTNGVNAVVGGTNYYYVNATNQFLSDGTTAGTVDWTSGVYAAYVDNNGFALGLAKISGTATLTSVYYVNYVYTQSVTAYGVTGTHAYAQVVALDGTVSVLEVGFDAGSVPASGSASGYYTKSGAVYTAAPTQDGTTTYYRINVEQGIMASFTQSSTTLLYVPTQYVTNSSYYVSNAASLALTSTLTKTPSVTDGTTATTPYLTSSTKYVVVNYDGANCYGTVLTGGVTITTSSIVIATKDTAGNYIASYVIVDSSTKYTGTQSGSDMLYVPKASTTVNGSSTYAVTAYDMAGTQKIITATSTGANNTFYSYAIDTNGAYVLTPVSANPTDTLDSSAAVWASTKTGIAYSEVFGGIYNGAITLYGHLQDIPATSAVIVDLHDTTASGQYAGTVSSLVDIASAAGTIKTSPSTYYAVTFDTYVSSTGVVVIFVTSIG